MYRSSQWLWTNDDPISAGFTNWATSEAVPAAGGGCLAMQLHDGLWKDEQCDMMKYTLCEAL